MASAPDLRTVGGLLVLSTPISAIVGFAALATVIGEDRLEGPDGLTGLGWLTVVLPPAFGLALVAWSATGRPAPGGRTLALALVVLGVTLAGIGIVALAAGRAGDANIGAGLLILVGLPLAVVGARWRWATPAEPV